MEEIGGVRVVRGVIKCMRTSTREFDERTSRAS
jgi:hypothetical protein